MRNVKIQAVLGRARGAFTGFTAGQRAVTIIAVVVAVVGLVVFAQWAGRPTMTPLYTNLSTADAAAVTSKLSERGVAYDLQDNSKTVLVPADKLDQARLDIAAANVVQNSPEAGGYALLDKSSLTSSDYQQKLTAKRAFEGELAKTIRKIDRVRDANVILALGEDSPYLDEQTKPTASVQVSMQDGAKLASGQVDAITHLVASAIPKLDASAVTVTDAKGVRYTDEGGGSGGTADAKAEQIRAISAQKTTQIQRFLDTIVGPGNSTVAVQADLDFDNTKVVRQEYIPVPAGAIPLVEQHSTEKMTGATGQVVGGVLGPDNITVPGLDQGTSKNDYSKDDFTKQNPYGTQTTSKDLSKGAVKKLSVAVAVDATKAGTYSTAELQKLIAVAAGIETPRDQIQVSKLAFDTKAAEAAKAKSDADAAAARQAELIDLGKNAGLVILLLLALLIGFRRSRKQTEVVDLGELPSAEQMGELPAIEPPLEYQLDNEPLPVIEATPVDPQSQARVLAREEIGSLVEEDPDEVARLLRGWISERS
ncbi:MAG: flagellar M-ring protein FliF [Austwickia sp.]|nr:flagellar M-ring protein FliF [Austwickia sp.]MCO5307741.1 flagellar M-ring protein FliF [Austwickia sp.]